MRQTSYPHRARRKTAPARALTSSNRRQSSLLGVVITILMALLFFMWTQQARAAVSDPVTATDDVAAGDLRRPLVR